MEAGEKEVKMAFEEVTTRNVRAAVDFSNTTRVIVRDLQSRVETLDRMFIQNTEKMELMQNTISLLQMRLYNAGIE